MESFSIIIPYEYVISKVHLTWQDIDYALDNNILSPSVVSKHANKIVEIEDEYSDDLLPLVLLNDGEPVSSYIKNLSSAEEVQTKDLVKQKWLYLLCSWIYENKNSFEDPLELIERVYADFDYPHELESSIRYMPLPSSESTLENIEENISRLYKNWEKYLLSYSEKFN